MYYVLGFQFSLNVKFKETGSLQPLAVHFTFCIAIFKINTLVMAKGKPKASVIPKLKDGEIIGISAQNSLEWKKWKQAGRENEYLAKLRERNLTRCTCYRIEGKEIEVEVPICYLPTSQLMQILTIVILMYLVSGKLGNLWQLRWHMWNYGSDFRYQTWMTFFSWELTCLCLICPFWLALRLGFWLSPLTNFLMPL